MHLNLALEVQCLPPVQVRAYQGQVKWFTQEVFLLGDSLLSRHNLVHSKVTGQFRVVDKNLVNVRVRSKLP